jgi:hypothetical protein
MPCVDDSTDDEADSVPLLALAKRGSALVNPSIEAVELKVCDRCVYRITARISPDAAVTDTCAIAGVQMQWDITAVSVVPQIPKLFETVFKAWFASSGGMRHLVKDSRD